MEPTYRLTLAPIHPKDSPSYLKAVTIQAQLTPLRSPSRKTVENKEELLSMLARLAPEAADTVMERLSQGEIVTLTEPVSRRTLISLNFEYI